MNKNNFWGSKSQDLRSYKEWGHKGWFLVKVEIESLMDSGLLLGSIVGTKNGRIWSRCGCFRSKKSLGSVSKRRS